MRRALLAILVMFGLVFSGIGWLASGRDAGARQVMLVEGLPFDGGQRYAAPLNSDYDHVWFSAAGAVVVLATALAGVRARPPRAVDSDR